MADVSASLRGMGRLSCMAATGSHRCRLLLQNLQSPEQSASADSEYGNQFAHRLTLVVQAQQALVLGDILFCRFSRCQASCDPCLAGGGAALFTSSSSSSAIVAIMLVTARPVGVLVSTPSHSDRT